MFFAHFHLVSQDIAGIASYFQELNDKNTLTVHNDPDTAALYKRLPIDKSSQKKNYVKHQFNLFIYFFY
jgi:hypothetical protein